MNLLAYDAHQFEKRNHPIHAEFVGAEQRIVSTHISWDDFSRMSTFSGGTIIRSPYDAKTWPYNDRSAAEVIVHYVERRSQMHRPGSGTLQERLAHAKQRIEGQTPKRIEALRNLCHKYVELKKADPTSAYVKKLSQTIESMDSEIIATTRCAQLAAGVVHFYFRMKYDSVETAAALSIKPPAARQLAFRLCRVATSLRLE